MLKSYEAIYDQGRIEWVGANPNLGRTRVVVVCPDAADEVAPEPNGKRFVELAKKLAETGFADKFGDPVAWQKEQRKDRLLAGREDNKS
ncbi:MAG: hypothetical protein NTY50_00600 [Methylobacter sp.]|nr:hypothetical protein [Methylobacter sp.]